MQKHDVRFPSADRLFTQLVLTLVAPTLLVGVLIGWPLIESRRTVLLEREHRRATLASETAAILFTERLQSGVQMITLLADRQVLMDHVQSTNLRTLAPFLAATRADTPFDCLAIESQQIQLAADGLCPATFMPTDGASVARVPPIGLVTQITAPIVEQDRVQGRLIGMIQIDRGMLDAARRQPDLELGIIVDQLVAASSLSGRVGMRVTLPVGDGPVDLHVDDQSFLAYYAPLVDLRGQQVAWIEVLLPLAPLWAAQLHATLIIAGGTITAIALAIALGWFVARRLAHSVDLLRQAATAIGDGDLMGTVTIPPGTAELRQLGAAIEQMRQQLAQTRHDLEAEKQRYAEILESIDEVVLTLDSAMHVTSINHGGEVLFGCAREQVIGLPLADIIAPDDGRPLRLASIPRHGAVRIAMRTATRQTLMVSASCAAAVSRNEQILVLRDVSDDAALQQLKDAFLANISHELRTPLAAQIASLEILREEDETLTPSERRQMLNALHSGVHRLDVLIQNLLDSASIEAGYFRVDPEPCQLAPLIHEAATLIHPLLRQRRQQITIDVDACLPTVFADGRRIIQVLVNLLANASKFGPHGDTLVITAQLLSTTMLQIEITDHGPGVPTYRRERLFERFVRPGVETVPEQGAGLGLAIVKAIIDQHHGTVIVLSGPTGGTTVAFTLPIVHGQMEGQHENIAGR